jgi:polyhydroxybutyrate depolymerase
MKALLLVLLLAFLTLPAQAAKHAIIPSGSARDAASVYVPELAQGPMPVVLLLHGYLGSSALMNYYFGLDKAVDQFGFILVVPNGQKNSEGRRYWDATEACCDFEHTKPQDAEYLKGLLQTLKRQYNVDENKIYVAGHSNGGFMAHRLACDPESGVSKIVSFAGEIFKDPSACKTTKPVSVLQIQALNDDTIRYQGDPEGYPNLAPYPGAEETVRQWAARNGCVDAPKFGPELNLTLSIPGKDATSKIWSQCRGQTSVQLYTIKAYQAFWHFPHTPALRQEFTDRVLGFFFPDAL